MEVRWAQQVCELSNAYGFAQAVLGLISSRKPEDTLSIICSMMLSAFCNFVNMNCMYGTVREVGAFM